MFILKIVFNPYNEITSSNYAVVAHTIGGNPIKSYEVDKYFCNPPVIKNGDINTYWDYSQWCVEYPKRFQGGVLATMFTGNNRFYLSPYVDYDGDLKVVKSDGSPPNEYLFGITICDALNNYKVETIWVHKAYVLNEHGQTVDTIG